jgi:hypothetical protein
MTMPEDAVSLPLRILRALAWRLPLLLLVAWALALNLSMPYRGLDSDVATFGLMGNDLLRHGYWPTLTYGQNYLFSLTPHLYALLRWLWPALSAPLALTLAGSLQTLAGLWLVYEALLRTEARAGRRLWPLIAFCVFIAGSWNYLFDLAVFSSIETSLLLLGLMVFAAARIESSPSFSRAGWGLLGLAAGFALCSRPQMLLFAAPAIVLLLRREQRRRNAVLVLLAGALLGYLPMLLHGLLRAADWPFQHHLPVQLLTFKKLVAAAGVFFGQIAPRIFALSLEHWPHALLVLGWIVTGCVAYLLAWRRRDAALSTLDHIWMLGGLALVLLMLLAPQLSLNQENRRYCLHLFLVVAWLAARFLGTPGWRRTAASAFLAALTLSALPAWREQLANARADDAARRTAEREFIPFLQQQGAPVLAHYWDAYLLAFLADGRLKIEAYPWDLVRTYGLLTEKEMTRRSFWLVTAGRGKETWQRLAQELGPDAPRQMRRQDCPLRLLGRECELWEFADGRPGVALLQKYHPRYFTTPYPPGARAP